MAFLHVYTAKTIIPEWRYMVTSIYRTVGQDAALVHNDNKVELNWFCIGEFKESLNWKYSLKEKSGVFILTIKWLCAGY